MCDLRSISSARFRVQTTQLTVVCALVLCGIIVAGLWPFHAPQNEVSWLRSENGIFLGEYGSVVGAHAFNVSGFQANAPCSLEIWLGPTRSDASGTILAFYQADTGAVPFALHQSLGDLVLDRASPNYARRSSRTKIYVDDIFSHAKLAFITISSGERGTAIYANGELVKTFPSVRLLSQNLTGQFIVGNAPTTNDSWSGQLKGIAVYNRELAVDEALLHYARWTKSQQTDFAKGENAVALYLFNEGRGNVVHNQVDSRTDLLIPKHFFVLHKEFLVWPWDEFYGGWSYWKNVGINVAGFVPLGFSFGIYFSSRLKGKRPAITTIAFGFVVSFTIEVLQGFLPTRDSGMTDIITNTLGTAIGAMFSTRMAVLTDGESASPEPQGETH